MTRLTTLNLPEFHRATVGFDRLFQELDRQFANSTGTSYPPYNIILKGENEYQISLAVAGFSMDNLEITQDGNELVVQGKPASSDDEVTYLHKGVANRGFKRTFTLADYVEVQNATLELGMLNISLVRRVPEELQPKRIAITEVKALA